MAQSTDLYSILISYANKNNSPYIEIDTFLEFLGKHAKKQSAQHPEWQKWLHERNVKFWAEVSTIAEEGRCELLTDTESGRIYMSHFYLDVIGDAYKNADANAELPFPSEDSLRITLPENQLKTLSAESDLVLYLEEPQSSDIPILKINFPYGFGSALVLASMVPKRLSEMAVLKVRNYLHRLGNREYALRKLTPQLQGRETFLREQLNQILTRPMDAQSAIIDGKELTYLFWAHFCILVKNDVKRKKEYLAPDISVVQAVSIIDAINGYSKAQATKRRDEELALNNLESHMNKPPFFYGLDQILKFKNQKGLPLLGQYTRGRLETWIKQKTTESENNELPVLLIISGPKNERFFCFKDKMLPLCMRLLVDARKQVTEAVSKRWRKMIVDYQSEPAMHNDDEFEDLLSKLTKKLCPMLSSLLEDPKMLLVYEEVEKKQNGIPAAVSIFNKGRLLPYAALYFMHRKDTLSDVKLILPFWHSLPIITRIIAFFKRLATDRKAIKLAREKTELEDSEYPEETDRAAEIRAAAEELELALVPPGHTLDSYLEELESKWSRLIDKKARENLIEDVKSLIRDHLRRNLKLKKHFQLTREMISQMAMNIVTRTPTLASLSGRDALILYAELYLLKLIQAIK